MQKKFALNTLGLILGFILGNGIVVFAQSHIQAHVDNAICWDQTAPTLVDARALKVELTWDTATPIVQDPICNNKAGSTVSPFECAVQVPMTHQTVGTHTLNYRVGTVEFDSSISYTSLVNFSYIIDPALKGAPALPSNTVIIKKKLLQLLELLSNLFW